MPEQVRQLALLVTCIYLIKFHIMTIATAIKLVSCLSACASLTHGTFAEHGSTSLYRFMGMGAFLKRRRTLNSMYSLYHAAMVMKQWTSLSLF